MNHNKLKSKNGSSTKYLSPLAVWALSFGCAVGWGAFMMPGTTFLPTAGPLGSVLGLLLGAGIMLVIGYNYNLMVQRDPDEGGSYSYAKNILGGDHGFLCGWMLLITYVAVIWANSTALSLVLRYLHGGVFCFGFSYQIFDYEVWFGEILLTVVLISATAIICIFSKKLAKWIQTVSALVLFLGVCACFIAVVVHNGGFSSIMPLFRRNHSPIAQVLGVVLLAPWAYVGFESVVHSAKSFTFSHKKTMPIFVVALITGFLAYAMLTVCASMACPDGFESWEEYLVALVRLNGVKGAPTFYNAQQAMGSTGLILLAVCAFCAIITALIGYDLALTHLIRAMAKDRMLPSRLAKTNRSGSPWVAYTLVAVISCLVSFLGRTTIGWIVDVTTVGSVVVYGYVSICSFVVGRREKKRAAKITGIIGTVTSVIFAVWYFLPSIWVSSGLSVESYMILILWALLGMIVFRVLVQQDKTRRFGKSEIVWIILFLLILIVSIAWIHRTTEDHASAVTQDVRVIHTEENKKEGISPDDYIACEANKAVTERIHEFSSKTIRNIFIQSGLVLCSLAVIFSIFNLIKKREKDIEEEKLLAEESSRAKTTFLNNMSHDIRTPMNAVTGYTKLALEEENLPDNIRDYLEKIDFSGKYLMSLINDILDMSRIESGKVELNVAPADLTLLLDEMLNLFHLQMESKGLRFTVDYSNVQNRFVFCDKHRLNRILLNLISNAYKFTPAGGSVDVILRQTGLEFSKASYELIVSDTGIGMSPEFKEHIFDAFERERTSTVSQLQGTGLGMSIAKSFVELMGGSIEVDSEKDRGTRFTLVLTFPIAREEDVEHETASSGIKTSDAGGQKLLLVEDNPINSEIACEILKRNGFETDTAENGKVAVEMVAAADPDTYSVILMDIQMPVMDGYEAARAIRALDGSRSQIPIIAVSANTFESDRKASAEAGMNDHVSKPFEPKFLIATINKYIR